MVSNREEEMSPQPVSLLRQIINKYSLPAIKVTLGLGFVFLARKAEISKNPIFHGSLVVDFILGSTKLFGALGAFHGIGQIAAS